ncbi:Recombination protein O N terminal [Thermocrinis minervae]|uniref:Recombination protein O N terminal n=2 Tax=Thermocrinis minervae TaxID=381751 RepID=A0A1M6QBU6_9AQUI|nr:Recombination protein O N terminal [Thermocrinis minervae]
MSSKARILVLKRFLAGDEDLIAKVYGIFGIESAFVRKGVLPESPFFGIFEPFNMMELCFEEKNGIVIPLDVSDLEPLSYLSLESYQRYLWMSAVASFILKYAQFYDEKLFSTFTFYLKKRVTNVKAFYLRLFIDFMNALGIYNLNVFGEEERRLLHIIESSDEKYLSRLKIDELLYRKTLKALEERIQNSL